MISRQIEEEEHKRLFRVRLLPAGSWIHVLSRELYELDNTEIVAMAGVSLNQLRLCYGLIRQAGARVGVVVGAVGLASTCCGRHETEHASTHTLANPEVVVDCSVV